jgi:hypothetical protein
MKRSPDRPKRRKKNSTKNPLIATIKTLHRKFSKLIDESRAKIHKTLSLMHQKNISRADMKRVEQLLDTLDDLRLPRNNIRLKVANQPSVASSEEVMLQSGSQSAATKINDEIDLHVVRLETARKVVESLESGANNSEGFKQVIDSFLISTFKGIVEALEENVRVLDGVMVGDGVQAVLKSDLESKKKTDDGGQGDLGVILKPDLSKIVINRDDLAVGDQNLNLNPEISDGDDLKLAKPIRSKMSNGSDLNDHPQPISHQIFKFKPQKSLNLSTTTTTSTIPPDDQNSPPQTTHHTAQPPETTQTTPNAAVCSSTYTFKASPQTHACAVTGMTYTHMAATSMCTANGMQLLHFTSDEMFDELESMTAVLRFTDGFWIDGRKIDGSWSPELAPKVISKVTGSGDCLSGVSDGITTSACNQTMPAICQFS